MFVDDEPLPLDLAVHVCHAEHVLDPLAILVGHNPGVNSVREAQSASHRDTEIGDLRLSGPGKAAKNSS